jgi:hypothetical protein
VGPAAGRARHALDPDAIVHVDPARVVEIDVHLAGDPTRGALGQVGAQRQAILVRHLPAPFAGDELPTALGIAPIVGPDRDHALTSSISAS